jgi:hypothetical protein
MKWLWIALFLISCGNNHTQNIETSPPAAGGAPQNTFTINSCVDGQKVSCEYSYSATSNGDVLITYGYRVCSNNAYGSCLKN